MIGGEYKKERFSERLTLAQNQPHHRGYLPGTHLKTDGYGTGTLMGNWSEERCDAGYYDGKAVVVSSLHPPMSTTYRDMVSNVSAPPLPAAPPLPCSSYAASQLPPSSTMMMTNNSCDRNGFSQETFMEIEDHTRSNYPGHQPHLDPSWQHTLATTHCSTFREAYTHPEEAQRTAAAFVPPVLGGSASSQSTGVLLRLRHQLKMDGGAVAATSAFPGNALRVVRQCLAQYCTDASEEINAAELLQGLCAAGIQCTTPECVALLRYFDKQGHHTAAISVLVDALRGPLTTRRMELVDSIYAMLVPLSGPDGVVRLDRMVDLIDVSYLPAVQQGHVTEDDARRAFREQWDARSPTAYISLERFQHYFSDASFEIEIDNDFELVMRNIWHLSGGRGVCENQSCRRVEVVRTNGRVVQVEVRNDLGIKGEGPAVVELIEKALVKQGLKDIKSIRVLSPKAQ